MKRVAAVLTLAALGFGAFVFAVRPHKDPRIIGVSAPSVFHTPAAPGRSGEAHLYFTGQHYNKVTSARVARLSGSDVVSASGKNVADFANGLSSSADSIQRATADRIYFTAQDQTAHLRLAFLSRLVDGQWVCGERPILRPGPTDWSTFGVGWVSVLPPEQSAAEWRMWYLGRGKGASKVGLATSRDGISWKNDLQPVYDPGDGESVESISIVSYAGGLQGWMVQRNNKAWTTQLLTVAFDAVDGHPLGIPEPVAWQAPKDWRQGLPKENIPIIDARADLMPDNPRHVRLFITYKGPDHKSRIAVAENFPVNGVYTPTVFSRQVRPVLEP